MLILSPHSSSSSSTHLWGLFLDNIFELSTLSKSKHFSLSENFPPRLWFSDFIMVRLHLETTTDLIVFSSIPFYASWSLRGLVSMPYRCFELLVSDPKRLFEHSQSGHPLPNAKLSSAEERRSGFGAKKCCTRFFLGTAQRQRWLFWAQFSTRIDGVDADGPERSDWATLTGREDGDVVLP